MTSARNGAPAESHPEISYPTNRPVEPGDWSPEVEAKLRSQAADSVNAISRNGLPRAFYPGGDRSLSGIAIRAFCLGIGAATGFVLTAALLWYDSRFWRPCFFTAALSVFHFLEFWTTAEYNTPTAYISAFLLTNGNHYRIAHTIAFVETILTSYFLPSWQARINPPVIIVFGLVAVVVGQVVRSVAMCQAGTNFNHQVQSKKNDGHELVTVGMYAFLRHPSYFGFFWWGLGTQIILGNTISLVGYAGVLWHFFNQRITHEEKHLIQFFGEEYKVYKARTRVGIPFIS
ncbi:prenyl cysteine carboxyl methyltransferas-like protein Ste14 [Corynespora cassiicola Philippines]|uniref:Protein-S-isoprenylcysteine O-methyltransferase n=1 Tax=Corynespora cassiicola Philippines TaxID=1448308 RepID=A0A2T2PAB7_CORCC|nr:prenyl cysteine carboxyl methyltransferas-like protein Ste14 [Corynespora cassiicola Philippines]